MMILISLPLQGFGWGKRGHDVICHIAERHLTPQALERVTQLLDGRSMVYYGNWMDGASRTDEYRHTYTWHYFNMELREDVQSAKRDPSGDVLSALEQIERGLSGGELSREQQAVALKMYIHLMGDLHQPMHLGRSGDSGGGDTPIVYFVESTSLHAVWDYHIVEGCHAWSYTEWGEQIDRLSESQIAQVQQGSLAEWIDATHEITREIYRSTPRGHRIFYEYLDHFTPIVEQQLLYAGLRLSSQLNSIFAEPLPEDIR